MEWILVVILLIIIVSLPLSLLSGNKEESFKGYSKAEDKCERASEGNSIKRLKENISNLEDAYQQASPYFSSKQKDIHAHNMNMHRENLRLLEEEKWQRKADKYLQDFADCYEIIRSHELEDFRDVELLLKYEKKCIDSWQKYFAIDLTEYESTLYPKRYLKEYMGDDYDPCMESKQALEKKLSEYIDHMRPEYKRKRKLYKILVDYVREVGSIKRADLFKTVFDGYTADEIKCCYRELIKKNRLVEIRLGNPYFVSLSDREAEKKSASKKKSAITVNSTQESEKHEWVDSEPKSARQNAMKKELNPKAVELWSKWSPELLNDEYAKRRIKSAQSNKLTPVKLDENDLYAYFQGAHGKYETFLDFCPCVDFVRSKRPCKHIFRLAMELGLLEVSFQSDEAAIPTEKSNIVSLQETVDKIELLSVSAQRALRDIANATKHTPCTIVDKDQIFEELLSSGFIECSKINARTFHYTTKEDLMLLLDKLNLYYDPNWRKNKLQEYCTRNYQKEMSCYFTEQTSVFIPTRYSKTKLYNYLNRKYADDLISDGKTLKRVPYLETDLPEDDVTDQLIARGYYQRK